MMASYIDSFTEQIVDNENIPYKIYKNNNGSKGDVVATLTPYSPGSDKVVENGKNFSVDGKVTHGYILSFGYIDDASIYNNTIPFGLIGQTAYSNGGNDFSNYTLEYKDYAKSFIEAAVYKNIRKNKYINTKHKNDDFYGSSQEVYGNFNTVYGDTRSVIGGYNNVICGDGSSSIYGQYNSAIGNEVRISGEANIAFGNTRSTQTIYGALNVAFGGQYNYVSGNNNISIGQDSTSVYGSKNINIGSNNGSSDINGNNNIAIKSSSANGDNNIILNGYGYGRAVAISGYAYYQSVAIGYGAGASNPNSDKGSSISIGAQSYSDSNGISIGLEAKTSDSGISLGENAGNSSKYELKDGDYSSTHAISIGKDSLATKNSVAFGYKSKALGADEENCVSFGSSAPVDLDGTGTTAALYRRVINIADGKNDHDAVTVFQIKATVKHYNAQKILITSTDPQTEFVISNKPENTSYASLYNDGDEMVQIVINHCTYDEGEDFTFDKAANKITWTATAANGGFDITKDLTDSIKIKYAYTINAQTTTKEALKEKTSSSSSTTLTL